MKTKNIIISVAAIATMIIGILVACEKEPTNQNTPENATKTLQNDMEIIVSQIWKKSDSAFRADSASFLNACRNENYSSFCYLTGIAYENLSEICLIADAQYVVVAEQLGTAWVKPSDCIPCTVGGLSAFGPQVKEYRFLMDSMKSVYMTDTLPVFAPYMDSCIVHCWYTLNPSSLFTQEDMALCLLNCNMSKMIRNARYNYMAFISK